MEELEAQLAKQEELFDGRMNPVQESTVLFFLILSYRILSYMYPLFQYKAKVEELEAQLAEQEEVFNSKIKESTVLFFFILSYLSYLTLSLVSVQSQS